MKTFIYMKTFIHIKSGRHYNLISEVGIKIWKWWFYFCVYRSPTINMFFIRTKKQFYKKFKEIG